MPTTLPSSRTTTDPTWASFMRPAQVATELVGLAVTTGRLMMSSTDGALVAVFAMSSILSADGYPVGGSAGGHQGPMSRSGFIQLYRVRGTPGLPLPNRTGLAGKVRMVKRPMSGNVALRAGRAGHVEPAGRADRSKGGGTLELVRFAVAVDVMPKEGIS